MGCLKGSVYRNSVHAAVRTIFNMLLLSHPHVFLTQNTWLLLRYDLCNLTSVGWFFIKSMWRRTSCHSVTKSLRILESYYSIQSVQFIFHTVFWRFLPCNVKDTIVYIFTFFWCCFSSGTNNQTANVTSVCSSEDTTYILVVKTWIKPLRYDINHLVFYECGKLAIYWCF
jgi:hypothetical protein